MGWIAEIDNIGPCNGDVHVRTAKGRMVAVVYAASTAEETMRRARYLIAAEGETNGVLKPFAALADWISDNRPEYDCDAAEVQIEGWPYTLSVGDLRRARGHLECSECGSLRAWLNERRGALNELVLAASRSWGAGSEQHNLVRDVADALFRDSDGTAPAALCEDIAVPKDCQARADKHRPTSIGGQEER